MDEGVLGGYLITYLQHLDCFDTSPKSSKIEHKIKLKHFKLIKRSNIHLLVSVHN